jgi:hypothetical protein
MRNQDNLIRISVELGYAPVRVLETGEVAGLRKMMFTTGLFVGLDRMGYRTRFCYPTFGDACVALEYWNGENDPPGPWIKEKGVNRETGEPVDRLRKP